MPVPSTSPRRYFVAARRRRIELILAGLHRIESMTIHGCEHEWLRVGANEIECVHCGATQRLPSDEDMECRSPSLGSYLTARGLPADDGSSLQPGAPTISET